MNDKVLSTIKRHTMFSNGERVYVAVSGGQDSACLLDIIMRLRTRFKLNVGIIHINHMLRDDESNKDAEFVRSLAKKHKVPLHVKDVNVKEFAQQHKLSLEDAARKCRYYAFVKFAKEKKIQKIAIAHTSDDQAETVLMRILRGTGLKGFRSIHPVVKLEGVCFVRPMIDVTLNEIQSYAASNKVRHRIDMSNKSIRFFRNKIRHELIPTLEEEYNPQIKNSLARMSESVHQDYQYLNSIADQEYKRAVKKEKETIIVLNKDIFDTLHSAIQYRVLSKAFDIIYSGFVFEFAQWQRQSDAFKKRRKYVSAVGKGILLEISGRDIVIKKQKQSVFYEYIVHGDQVTGIKEAGVILDFKAVDSPAVHKSKVKGKEVIDLDKLTFPLIVRNRKNGDRMKPLGMRYEKKLTDIMIDKKIPHYVRNEMPLLISKGKIVWCWGIGIADQVKISSHTKRGLEIGFAYAQGTRKRD